MKFKCKVCEFYDGNDCHNKYSEGKDNCYYKKVMNKKK